MSKIKCYSVRLNSLTEISVKAYKAKAFDGSSAIIPKSMVFGNDYEVLNSDAYWIAAFILEKDDCELQYSTKKEAWFDRDTGNMLPTYTIEKHVPERKLPVDLPPDKKLMR